MDTSSRTWITLAAALVLTGASGCKKDETTSPDEATPPAEEGDLDAEEEPEEVEAPAEDAEPAAAILTKASFDATVNEHFQEVSDCYVAALEANGDLAGKLHLEFTIGAEGTVTAVTVVEDSTLTDEGLVACVTEAANGWQFDKPTEEMNLRYPFTLEPG